MTPRALLKARHVFPALLSLHPSLLPWQGIPESNQTEPGPGCPLKTQVQCQGRALGAEEPRAGAEGVWKRQTLTFSATSTNRNPRVRCFYFHQDSPDVEGPL